jgi:hypothetical protein
MTWPTPADVARAITRIRSLHDGEWGLIDAVACGSRAVPALRALLFERDPSGIYEPRRLAVQALAALGAHDVLVEFLSEARDAPDAVERVGDDAVMNAAARALAGVHEERIFQVLMDVAERRRLPGVIAALGALQRSEAIPHLVDALAEDDARPAAEAGLRAQGAAARSALVVTAARLSPSADNESISSLRRRRSALGLLSEIGIEPQTWPVIRPLMRDKDAKVAILACGICLGWADRAEAGEAVRRLIELLPNVDWMVVQGIENYLVACYDQAQEIIARMLADGMLPGDRSERSRVLDSLLRVRRRAREGCAIRES